MKNLVISEDRRKSIVIAHAIKDNFLRDMPVESIADGIKRVGHTESGVLTHGFLRPGLFASVCHRRYSGSRRRKSFRVDGYLIQPVTVLKGEKIKL